MLLEVTSTTDAGCRILGHDIERVPRASLLDAEKYANVRAHPVSSGTFQSTKVSDKTRASGTFARRDLNTFLRYVTSLLWTAEFTRNPGRDGEHPPASGALARHLRNRRSLDLHVPPAVAEWIGLVRRLRRLCLRCGTVLMSAGLGGRSDLRPALDANCITRRGIVTCRVGLQPGYLGSGARVRLRCYHTRLTSHSPTIENQAACQFSRSSRTRDNGQCTDLQSTCDRTRSPGPRRRCGGRWPRRRSATTSSATTRRSSGSRRGRPTCSGRRPPCSCRRGRWPTRSASASTPSRATRCSAGRPRTSTSGRAAGWPGSRA